MSDCSWGGYGVWVHENNGKWERKDERDTTLHVESTPHHCCEQLLAWWITVCKTTPLTFMRGFFLFILFHLKLVVTAPLPARRGVLLRSYSLAFVRGGE
jgi:hypothetical protein